MYQKKDFLEAMEAMGIRPDGTLLIHSSMKSIGEVEGGAETVLDACCEYMKDGLLAFPTHTWNEMGKTTNVYDSRNMPSCVGILPNLFLKRPGVVRSLHPTHSVAALGKEGAAYISGEELSDTPCPRTGCWGRLWDRDADILFLGCTLNSNTFIHGVEEWNNIPERVSDWTQALTIIGPAGEEYHVDMHRHNSHCPDGTDVSEHYGKLEPAFLKHGAIRYGTFGDARCILGNARRMEKVTSALLKIDAQLFISNEAIPDSWY